MSANSGAQDSKRGGDIAKWIITVLLLVVAVGGNYLYREFNLALRALAVVILFAAAGGVALWTTQGKATLAFAREARIEMRKVVWPTRQETLRDNINRCCGDGYCVIGSLGTGWHSGSFSFIYYWPVRCS